MKEFKGTKGEWIVKNPNLTNYHIKNIDGEFIAEVPIDGYQGMEANEANAKLIAAAPQLLDALQKCKRVLASYNSDKAIDTHYIASEAIKKALGQ